MGVAAIDLVNQRKTKETRQLASTSWVWYHSCKRAAWFADSMENVAIVKPGVQWIRQLQALNMQRRWKFKSTNKQVFNFGSIYHLNWRWPPWLWNRPTRRHSGKNICVWGQNWCIAGWKSAAFLIDDAFSIIDVEMPMKTQHVVHLPEKLLETILVYAYRGKTGTVNKKHIAPAHVARLVIGDRLSGSDIKLPECNSDAAPNDSIYGVIKLETKADEYCYHFCWQTN